MHHVSLCQKKKEKEKKKEEARRRRGRRKKNESQNHWQALKSKQSHNKIIAWNTLQQQSKRQKTKFYLKIKLHPYHLFSNQ